MSLSWCSLNHCKSDGPDADASLPEPELDVYGNSTNNASNHSNFSCHYPFCVSCLTYTIGESQVRVYDLALVFFNVLFLVLLLLNLVPTIKKLYRSFLLFKILYSMVFVIPVVTVIHGTISMAHGYTQQSAKATQVLVRGAILMTEMSVIIFGLFFKSYVHELIKLWLTVFTVILIAIVFTISEGLSEFLKPDTLACHNLELFTHGGMIFLFTTSVLFATVYLLVFLLYMFGLSKRWNFPSKKSFYRYTLVLSLVNVAQAIGSMLWYTGKDQKKTGHAGICITTITTFVYLTTFAPVVYWIFLKNYFRMNNPDAGRGKNTAINVSSEVTKRRSSNVCFSKPIISRRSTYFEEQANMIDADDYDSSISSYGSLLRDEEVFSKLNVNH